MATRIKKSAAVPKPPKAPEQPVYLYVTEWMVELGLTDIKLAEILVVKRETVWRWQKEQRRLTPPKQARLARAMGIEPEQLWRPPSRPSVDAILKNAPLERYKMVVDIAQRIIQPDASQGDVE